jgi:hypothetical protein
MLGCGKSIATTFVASVAKTIDFTSVFICWSH